MLNKSNIRDYQLNLIKEIKERKKVLLAVDMGLGKTISCLTAIEEMPELKKILIVAPKKVATITWPDEINEWEHLKDISYTVIKGTEKQRLKCMQADTRIYLINREILPWFYANNSVDFDLLIWDESSSLKSAKLKTIKGELSRYGALMKMNIERMIFLTGTPTPNGLQDIYGQIAPLDKDILGKSKYKFLEEYFIDRSRDPVFKIWEPRSTSYDIVMKKIEHLIIKMKSDDYLTLPDFIPINKMVELDNAERDMYDKLKNHMILKTEEIIAANKAVLMNKLLQVCTGSVYREDGTYRTFHTKKLEALKELIEDDENEHENFLVFYNFQHEKEQLQAIFDNVTILKDDEDIKNWNNRKIKILACHPASAGHGLNLQKGGSIMVWLSLPWSLELYQQANKRLHRSGQDKAVRCFHILTKNTVDEYVLNILQAKDKRQELIINLMQELSK